jgi:hypothetical protein
MQTRARTYFARALLVFSIVLAAILLIAVAFGAFVIHRETYPAAPVDTRGSVYFAGGSLVEIHWTAIWLFMPLLLNGAAFLADRTIVRERLWNYSNIFAVVSLAVDWTLITGIGNFG